MASLQQLRAAAAEAHDVLCHCNVGMERPAVVTIQS